MRTFLELLRAAALLLVLTAIGGLFLEILYSNDSGTGPFVWLGGIAVLLLIFVLYRNKLQFSGWHSGKEQEKLTKGVTGLLISGSILLLASPFVLGILFP